MRYLFSFSLLVACTCFLTAQVTFNKRFDLGFPAGFLSGVIPTDSCFYAIGSANNGSGQLVSTFTRFSLQGEPVLVKEHAVLGALLSTAEPAFVKDGEGNFFVAGTLQDSIRKVYLLKYNGEGDTLFAKKFVHPLYPVESFVYVFDLVLTSDGGVVLCGNLEMPTGVNNTDLFVMRADIDGNLLFFKPYGSTQFDDLGNSILVAGDGFIVGGNRNNTNMTVEGYTFRAQFLHLDGEGNVDWEYLTPDSYLSDRARDMVLLDDGSLVVASGIGTENDNVSVNTVWFEKAAFKLNTQEEIEWQVSFPEIELTGSAVMKKIVKLSDGSGFVLAGTAAEVITQPEAFPVRGWVAKIKNDGTKSWDREYTIVPQLNSTHRILDMKECPDGGLILCGEARDMTGQDSIPQQGWLLKLDAHGCLIPGCHLLDAAGETEMLELELAIYPNPTSDYLNFELRGRDAGRTASFRITDMNGRVLHSFESATPGATHIVPVWDWAAGVYFLQCVVEGAVRASERFVVAK